MKEFVCNYAAVRFLPYPETGEFVNVGVVVYCPEIGYFDFRMKGGRNGRIHQFFPELNGKIWQAAIEAFRAHLTKFQHGSEFRAHGVPQTAEQAQRGVAAFQHLVRRRESLLHFAEPSVILAAEPERALDELFHQLVEHKLAQRKNSGKTQTERLHELAEVKRRTA